MGCTKTAVIYYTNIIGQHLHHVKLYKNCTTIVCGTAVVAAAVLAVVSYCLIARNIIRIWYQWYCCCPLPLLHVVNEKAYIKCTGKSYTTAVLVWLTGIDTTCTWARMRENQNHPQMMIWHTNIIVPPFTWYLLADWKQFLLLFNIVVCWLVGSSSRTRTYMCIYMCHQDFKFHRMQKKFHQRSHIVFWCNSRNRR